MRLLLSFLPPRLLNITLGQEPDAARVHLDTGPPGGCGRHLNSCFLQVGSCQEKQLHKQDFQPNDGLFRPLLERLVRAESDGGMGQPNLNSISPRISIKEQYFKSMAQPGGNEITRWKICITGEALCPGQLLLKLLLLLVWAFYKRGVLGK